MKVLIIEDQYSLADAIAETLKRENFVVKIVADGEEYLNESNKNLFYTVCTRALHELKVFTKKSLEEILPSNKTLYEIEER